MSNSNIGNYVTNFRCVLINVRSICNKLPELQNLLYAGFHDVILITETWANSKLPNSILDPANKFCIYRCDRSDDRHGGGVCIMVNRLFNSVQIDTSNYLDTEICCIDVSYSGSKCRFVAAYQPPGSGSTDDCYLSALLKCTHGLLDVSWPCFVAGDFNSPHIDWNNVFPCCNNLEQKLCDFAMSHGLVQVVPEPTRDLNLLDIILANEPITVSNVAVEPPFGNSDHCQVNFTITLEAALQPNDEMAAAASKYCIWSQADYTSMVNYLNNINWTQLFCDNITVDSIWQAFLNVLLTAIDCYVPSRLCASASSTNKRSYPKSVRKAIARKRCLWRKHKKEPTNTKITEAYKKAERLCTELLGQYEIQQEQRCLRSNNFGSFYKFVNSRLSCKSGVGAIRANNGETVTNDKKKAEMLNDYFCSVGTQDNGILPDFPSVMPSDDVLDTIDFSPVAITRAIAKLKSSTSCGPDSIPPVMIKMLR
jgi:hypothetical protein